MAGRRWVSSSPAASLARKEFGLEVITGTIDDAASADLSMVTLWDVEHVRTPMDTMKVWPLLRTGGYCHFDAKRRWAHPTVSKWFSRATNGNIRSPVPSVPVLTRPWRESSAAASDL
jgi:hypothetical protein